MAPTIILIRHAEAEHNATNTSLINPSRHNYQLPDPNLTPLGFQTQCSELAQTLQTDEFSIAQKVELIVSSPMRRTIQTTQQGLGWLIDRGVPIILRPEWQENSDKPCDTGSPIDEVSREFPELDWSTVDPLYPSKTGLYAFTRQGLKNRGIEAKRWLKARPEKVIAVVSHSGFLRVGISSARYENADFRIFEFAEGEGEEGLELVEWEVTEKKGGGLGKSEKGRYPVSDADNIPDAEIPQDKDVGEVVKEKPGPTSKV